MILLMSLGKNHTPQKKVLISSHQWASQPSKPLGPAAWFPGVLLQETGLELSRSSQGTPLEELVS
jgi:hypothetical protein